jgi:DNA-binding SARP family transcriptional activator
LIWPDIDPKAGKNNLNVAICHLRRTLAQGGMTRPIVSVQNNTCQLERGLAIWTDSAAFEEHARCARAHVRANQPILAVDEFAACIALYHNELLAEDRYESWLAPYRQGLRDQYVEALDYLARRHLEAGDHVACSTTCQKLLGVDPCNEAAHRTLMRCYAALGQPNLMQRQYRNCVSALRSELGVAPGSETTALYRSLARG